MTCIGQHVRMRLGLKLCSAVAVHVWPIAVHARAQLQGTMVNNDVKI